MYKRSKRDALSQTAQHARASTPDQVRVMSLVPARAFWSIVLATLFLADKANANANDMADDQEHNPGDLSLELTPHDQNPEPLANPSNDQPEDIQVGDMPSTDSSGSGAGVAHLTGASPLP